MKILLALILFFGGFAQAKSRPQQHRACIPLPTLGTPITQVPSDIREYCDPPWVRPETVEYTCQVRLTQVNAYGLCHYECGPQHDNGSAAYLCSQACYARMCQYGR